MPRPISRRFSTWLTLACLVISTTAAAAPPPVDADRWSAARADAWYAKQPWLCGFNYLPSDAINSTEMWAADTFDPDRIDRELGLAQSVGFNAARVFVQYLDWEHDRAGLHARMDRFLTITAKHGIRVMFVPFDDCYFGHQGPEPIDGRQPAPVPGEYASGFTSSPGPRRAHDPQYWPQLHDYVTDLLTWYGHDDRVIAWDLYNEVTNCEAGDESLPLLRAEWAWARAAHPEQPTTVCYWAATTPRLNRIIFDHADVITFHNYSPSVDLRKEIALMRKLGGGRPVICTEWLNRPMHSTVADELPVFAAEHVGCFCWGLVNGKTQTNYPWGSKAGSPPPKLWQHDLWHTDLTPYDPAELALFRRTTAAQNGERR